MGYQKPSIDAENLFGFNLISHVALVVDSPCVIARSRPVMDPSRNEGNRHLALINHTSCLSEVTLDKRSQPHRFYVLSKEFSIQTEVPKVALIGGYGL
jgi:hypothetical protein